MDVGHFHMPVFDLGRRGGKEHRGDRLAHILDRCRQPSYECDENAGYSNLNGSK